MYCKGSSDDLILIFQVVPQNILIAFDGLITYFFLSRRVHLPLLPPRARREVREECEQGLRGSPHQTLQRLKQKQKIPAKRDLASNLLHGLVLFRI